MKTFAATMLLSLLFAVSAALGQTLDGPARAQKLDQLFLSLKAAKSEGEGLALEEQIVSLWLQSGDPKIDEKMDSAITAMDSGSPDLAFLFLDSIILNKPDYVEGWNKRATLNYVLGRYQESLDDIARTLAIEPRHFGAIAGKGMVLEEMGRDEEALAAFKQALLIDPQLTSIQVEVFLLEDRLHKNRI